MERSTGVATRLLMRTAIHWAIMNEKLKSGQRATIYDVAARAGVSKSLVSLVLHGDERVSEERRRAVEKAIEELGYKPSRAASLLAGRASKTIGVVVEDYASPWFVGLIEGMRSVLDPEGYQITISDLHQLNAGSDDAVDNFMSLHIDGLVLGVEPSAVHSKSINVPCVVVNERFSSVKNADLVKGDDYNGTRALIKYLISLGHKKIGHVSTSSGPAKPRRDAYLDEMAEAGLRSHVVGLQTEPNSEDAYSSARELFEEAPDLTAVFAANDSMAAGVIAYLKQQGKEVPRDVSVVGYDNSPVAREFMLNLTTVDSAGAAIGAETALMILDRIQNPGRKARQKLIPSALITRGSTKAI
jgi:DNA-binding LacI/PurR family transcriptional regulator